MTQKDQLLSDAATITFRLRSLMELSRQLKEDFLALRSRTLEGTYAELWIKTRGMEHAITKLDNLVKLVTANAEKHLTEIKESHANDKSPALPQVQVNDIQPS